MHVQANGNKLKFIHIVIYLFSPVWRRQPFARKWFIISITNYCFWNLSCMNAWWFVVGEWATMTATYCTRVEILISNNRNWKLMNLVGLADCLAEIERVSDAFQKFDERRQPTQMFQCRLINIRSRYLFIWSGPPPNEHNKVTNGRQNCCMAAIHRIIRLIKIYANVKKNGKVHFEKKRRVFLKKISIAICAAFLLCLPVRVNYLLMARLKANLSRFLAKYYNIHVQLVKYFAICVAYVCYLGVCFNQLIRYISRYSGLRIYFRRTYYSAAVFFFFYFVNRLLCFNRVAYFDLRPQTKTSFHRYHIDIVPCSISPGLF